jgi:hypothetical protein
MDGGIFVVIFIFGGEACANAPTAVDAIPKKPIKKPVVFALKVFIFRGSPLLIDGSHRCCAEAFLGYTNAI